MQTLGSQKQINPNVRQSCFFIIRQYVQWFKQIIRYFENILRHFSLTHWGRDKIATISQTTFSNAFSGMKMYVWILFKISLTFVLRFKWMIFHHWLRYWLGADQATSCYLNQWWLNYWRIYASLGPNELNPDETFSDGQTICLMILNKSPDFLQNHQCDQQCLFSRWLFVNTEILKLWLSITEIWLWIVVIHIGVTDIPNWLLDMYYNGYQWLSHILLGFFCWLKRSFVVGFGIFFINILFQLEALHRGLKQNKMTWLYVYKYTYHTYALGLCPLFYIVSDPVAWGRGGLCC